MKAEIKPGFGHERSKLNEVIPLDTPFTMNIVPSTICNFKCKYCVHSLPKEALDEKNFKPSLLDWDMFLKAAGQLLEFERPLKVISLTGNGESLCNKKLPEMVAYLKRLKAAERIEFISNGALLDNGTSIALIDAGLDTIRISIQGMSSEKYFDICGARLDLKELINKIQFLYQNKNNCNVYVKVIDIALEKGQEEEFYRIFGEISDRVFIEKVMPVYNGVDYSGMVKDTKVVDRYGRAHERRYVCPQCFFTLTVWPNGDVYPCDVLSDPGLFGNITEKSLKNIWNGSERKEFLRMQLLKNRMDNAVCKNCCAPDDVSQPEDELDQYAEQIIKRL